MRPYFIFEYIVLITGLTVQRLPQLVEEGPLKSVLLVLTVLPFCLIITINVLLPMLVRGKISVSIRKYDVFLFSLLIILILISLIRGYAAGSLDFPFFIRHAVWWVTIVLFGFALFFPKRDYHELVKLRRGIYYSIGIYVAFNVILQLVGIESTRQIVVWDSLGKATVLSIFGIDATRVAFATASGPGPFGVVSGIAVLFGIMLAIGSNSRMPKILGICIFTVGLYAVLLTDSRASIFWLLVTPLVYFVGWRKFTKLLPLLPVVSLILPLLAISFAVIVASSPLGEVVGRSKGAVNVATLSNRSVVWDNVLQELKDFKPIHLVGFGARGQVASGVGEQNAKVFKENYAKSVDQKTAHNFALQTILDMGYIGLLLLVLLLSRIIKIISSFGVYSDPNMHISFIIFIVLVGATEVVPTIYANEIFTTVLLLIISILHKDDYAKSVTVTVPSLNIWRARVTGYNSFLCKNRINDLRIL